MHPTPENQQSDAPAALDSLTEEQRYDLIGAIYFGEAAQMPGGTGLAGLLVAPVKQGEKQ